MKLYLTDSIKKFGIPEYINPNNMILYAPIQEDKRRYHTFMLEFLNLQDEDVFTLYFESLYESTYGENVMDDFMIEYFVVVYDSELGRSYLLTNCDIDYVESINDEDITALMILFAYKYAIEVDQLFN